MSDNNESLGITILKGIGKVFMFATNELIKAGKRSGDNNFKEQAKSLESSLSRYKEQWERSRNGRK